MIKNVGVCAAVAAVGAGLLVIYAVFGGPAFCLAAITAGVVTLTLRKARESGDETAVARALPWVFSVALVCMVAMVISMGVRQVHPLYLLMMAMMALGLYSSMSSRGQASEQR